MASSTAGLSKLRYDPVDRSRHQTEEMMQRDWSKIDTGLDGPPIAPERSRGVRLLMFQFPAKYTLLQRDCAQGIRRRRETCLGSGLEHHAAHVVRCLIASA